MPWLGVAGDGAAVARAGRLGSFASTGEGGDLWEMLGGGGVEPECLEGAVAADDLASSVSARDWGAPEGGSLTPAWPARGVSEGVP